MEQETRLTVQEHADDDDDEEAEDDNRVLMYMPIHSFITLHII